MRAYSARASGPGAKPALYVLAARAGALAALLALKSSLPGLTYFSVLFAFGLTHYALGFVYSRQALGARLSDPAARLKLALLAAVGLAAAVYSWKLAWFFFGVHMTLTDVWLLEEAEGRPESSLCAPRVALSLSAYTAIAFAAFGYPGAPVLWAAAAASLLWLLAALRAAGLPREAVLRTLAFESFWLVTPLLASLLGLKLHNLDLVLHHGFMWLLAPLPDMAREPGRIPRYLAANAASVGALLLLTPVFPSAWTLSGPRMYGSVNFIGNLHIFLSLALSRLNPQAVVARFSPRPA